MLVMDVCDGGVDVANDVVIDVTEVSANVQFWLGGSCLNFRLLGRFRRGLFFRPKTRFGIWENQLIVTSF
jgi:hypothetical protein